jgi:hypothetical protein
MRIFRLFRRYQPVVTYSEPPRLMQPDALGLHNRDLTTGTDDELLVEAAYAAGEDMRGENAVFGLIDTAASGQAMTQHARGTPGEPDVGEASDATRDRDVNRDVIKALHDQYWRALDDPQASLAGTWAMQTGMERGSGRGEPGSTAEGTDDPASAPSTDDRSIEALLSGARHLEDVFGPLRKGDVPEAEVESIPEILRLFAPAEYLAAVSRRPPALPAALTRREHQTPGIDSPLRAPDSTPHHETP